MRLAAEAEADWFGQEVEEAPFYADATYLGCSYLQIPLVKVKGRLKHGRHVKQVGLNSSLTFIPSSSAPSLEK